MSNEIENITFAENVITSLLKVWRNVLKLWDRAAPFPEDGWDITEPFISGTVAGSIGLSVSSANGGSSSVGATGLSLTTGTTVGGVTAAHLDSTMDLLNGSVELVARVNTLAALASNEVVAYIGFGDSESATSKTGHTDGFGFLYDPLVDGANWRCVSFVSGTKYDLADSGIVYGAETRIYRITTAMDGSAITFQSKLPSDASWTTHHIETTNLPASAFGLHIAHEKAAGSTSRSMYVRSLKLRHRYLNA